MTMKDQHRQLTILAACGLAVATVMATLAVNAAPPARSADHTATDIVALVESSGGGEGAYFAELDLADYPRRAGDTAALLTAGRDVCAQLRAGVTIGAVALRRGGAGHKPDIAALGDAETLTNAAREHLCR
jgi:hypothetical protein